MSSSSLQSYRQQYDVFLSFMEDTRYAFTSHLFTALTNSKIKTFMDKGLEKGTELTPELLRAIEGSRISVVVFSQGCAGSRRCLDELVKIMDCHRTIGQLVLPVFYHVDPSHVRHQEGDFGDADAYKTLAEDHSGVTDAYVLRRWRRALKDAANLAGWHVTEYTFECDIIQRIVKLVIGIVDKTSLSITKFPVGLESRAQDVTQLLKEQSSTVSVIGIWGMGGSGKTTLAKVIYNQIHYKFEGASFLEDVREVCEIKRGQIDLQKQLLSNVLKLKKLKIHSIEWGKAMIKERLCRMKLLLVLDDVNNVEQLQALCGNRTWIGPGSVLIITTRDLHVLNVLKADHVYSIKEMDESESLELFSWHAFMEKRPREDFIELSRNVVTYCGGLPLALEVFGSNLYNTTKEEWIGVLSKPQMIPNRVQKMLRISYDTLSDHTMQDIFLDICCFFLGKDKAYVAKILDDCGLYAEIGISVLIEQSLVKVEKNKLRMHNLLRDMGREIIRQSSPKDPEKWSRLWFHEDVHDILTKNLGTQAIEGLALNMQRSNRASFNTKTFETMKRLRLLQLNYVNLSGDYGYLPKQLRWICWQGFPLKYMPSNFYQGNLVAIDLRHSELKLVWKETQVLERLKFLNLSHSRYLTNTPDLSNLPNLEKLILKDCPRLSKVHQSIGDHNNLQLINMAACTSLRNLPRMIYKLKSLKTLIISSCSNIGKLEEDIEQMECLTTLLANKTAVKQVPFSILKLKSIEYISLCGFEGLSCDVFPSFIWSWMSPTLNLLSSIHQFGGMLSSLVSMDIHNMNLGDLSSILNCFSQVKSVRVQCRSKFQLIEDYKQIRDGLYDANVIDLQTSYASQISQHLLQSLLIGTGCYQQVMDTLAILMSQELFPQSSEFYVPPDNFPFWLTCIGEGHSVLKVPKVRDYHLKGMILCVVFSTTLENMADKYLISLLIVNYTRCSIQLYKRDVQVFSNNEWQGILSNLESCDEVEIFVTFGSRFPVNKTALYLIYGESIDRDIEPSSKQRHPLTKSAIMSLSKCSEPEPEPSPKYIEPRQRQSRISSLLSSVKRLLPRLHGSKLMKEPSLSEDELNQRVPRSHGSMLTKESSLSAWFEADEEPSLSEDELNQRVPRSHGSKLTKESSLSAWFEADEEPSLSEDELNQRVPRSHGSKLTKESSLSEEDDLDQ